MLKKIGKVFCAATLMVGVAQAQEASAPSQTTAKEIVSQPLTAGITNKGLTLASPLTDISFFSSIMAIEPPWRTPRFYSEHNGETGDKEILENSYVVKMKQTNGTHEFKLNDYSATVTGDTVRVVLDCEATADIPNHFEYSAFAIPYALINGCEYTATLSDGSVVTKKISLREPDVAAPMYKSLKKITFKATIGDLTIEVIEGPGIELVDRRGVTFATKKCFWMGMQADLAYGKPVRSVIDVTFKLKDSLVISKPIAVDASKPMTTTVANDGIQPYVADLELLPVPKEIIQPMPENNAPFKVANNKITVSIDGILLSQKTDTAPYKRTVEEYNRLGNASKRIFNKLDITANLVENDANVKISIEPNASKNLEGYTLKVDAGQITIASPTPRGAFYGLQTLRQLYKNGQFPAIKIVDYPDMELRAAFCLVDDYSKIFHTNMVDDILAPMKYNYVVLEAELVKWDSTKAIHTKGGMEKEDYIKLVKWCEDNYIDVIPLVQTLGHCGWLFPTKEDGTRMNLEWAEDPRYPYAYNVSAPGLYEFVEVVLDEVLAASGDPEYFHIGHDEVYHPKAEYPHRPENKAKGIPTLLYEDLMWYHSFGKERDLKIMLWHDLFVTKEESPENGSGGPPNNTVDIRHKLPKDLIFVAWRYDGKPTDFPDITALHNEGFPLVGASWYEKNNVENLTTFCNNLDALGMIQTIWNGYNGNKVVSHSGFFQLTPYIRTGAWSWNANPSVNNFEEERVYSDLTSARLNPSKQLPVTMVDISNAVNLKLDAASNPFLNNTDYGMGDLATGEVQVGRVKFNLPAIDNVPAAVAMNSRLNPLFPKEVNIPVDIESDELYLLMNTVDSAPPKFATVATLVVEYENGENYTLPLQYNYQVGAIDDSFNYYQNTSSVREWKYKGKNYRSWFYPVTLPKDKKGKIKNIKLQANDNGFAFYLLGLSAK